MRPEREIFKYSDDGIFRRVKRKAFLGSTYLETLSAERKINFFLILRDVKHNLGQTYAFWFCQALFSTFIDGIFDAPNA